MNKKQISITALIILTMAVRLSGQNINRNVVVVKPYEPSLSDVYKLGTPPRFEDTASVVPSFEYSIIPVRIDAPFEVKPINAAKMIGTPLEKLYKSYLKLGIGNYFTPLAEFNFNSLRSKDRSYGLFLMHTSSGRSIELNNGDKVPAGYSINKVELFGNKYYNDADLSGSFSMGDHGVHYYGYNTALFTDSFPEIRGRDIRQNYSHIAAAVDLNSTFTDSAHLNYRMGLDAGYTSDRYNNHESHINLSGNLNKLFGDKVFGLDLAMDYIKPGISIDSSAKTIVGGGLYFGKKTADYDFRIGGKMVVSYGSESKFYLFPVAYLQFNIVRSVLLPYVGVDGNVTPGTYYDLVNENPYVKPATTLQNSDRLYAFAGLKGLLSSKWGFDASISYNIINNMGLYVNDSTGEWDNQFGIVYDDLTLVKLSGEVYCDPLKYVHFMIQANLFSYTPDMQAKAWHKPAFDLTLNTQYTLKEKILFSLNIVAMGTRYAKPYVDADPPVKLDPILDINLGIEYRYSKILSAFLNFYNLTSSRYYYWNQYPAQKLNLMIGFTYKL